MQGYFPVMRYSPTLRFTVFGAMSYTVLSIIGILISLSLNRRYLHFTEASPAYSQIGLYGLFHYDHVRLDVLHRAAAGWSGMAYATLIKLHSGHRLTVLNDVR